jgi:large subunit ribosomal protein L33
LFKIAKDSVVCSVFRTLSWFVSPQTTDIENRKEEPLKRATDLQYLRCVLDFLQTRTAMVKTGALIVKLVSLAGTGFCYYTKKNPKYPKKLMFRKFDPKVNAHVLFKVCDLRLFFSQIQEEKISRKRG